MPRVPLLFKLRHCLWKRANNVQNHSHTLAASLYRRCSILCLTALKVFATPADLANFIAAVISYVDASRPLEDFGISEAESKRRKRRYAFGRFMGTDGKTHIGIELQDYIIPLEARNPEVKRKRWNWRWTADEKESRNWI